METERYVWQLKEYNGHLTQLYHSEHKRYLSNEYGKLVIGNLKFMWQIFGINDEISQLKKEEEFYEEVILN